MSSSDEPLFKIRPEPLVQGLAFETFHRRLTSYKEPSWKRLLCLDPGETTGVALFEGHALIAAGQLNTSDANTAGLLLQRLVLELAPDRVVIENYQVYAWKAQSHTHSTLHTPRIIGMVEFICSMHVPTLPLIKQTAQSAKGLATDERLKDWGFWLEGFKHARDAIRHGIYHTIVPSEPQITHTKKRK